MPNESKPRRDRVKQDNAHAGDKNRVDKKIGRGLHGAPERDSARPEFAGAALAAQAEASLC